MILDSGARVPGSNPHWVDAQYSRFSVRMVSNVRTVRTAEYVGSINKWELHKGVGSERRLEWTDRRLPTLNALHTVFVALRPTVTNEADNRLDMKPTFFLRSCNRISITTSVRPDWCHHKPHCFVTPLREGGGELWIETPFIRPSPNRCTEDPRMLRKWDRKKLRRIVPRADTLVWWLATLWDVVGEPRCPVGRT